MIDRQTFSETIELIRQQILFDRRIGETIQEAFGVHQKCSYMDNMAIQAVVKLLQVHFPKDENGFCRIEFYIDCLEFGRTTENSDEVTASELYDTLIEDLKG